MGKLQDISKRYGVALAHKAAYLDVQSYGNRRKDKPHKSYFDDVDQDTLAVVKHHPQAQRLERIPRGEYAEVAVWQWQVYYSNGTAETVSATAVDAYAKYGQHYLIPTHVVAWRRTYTGQERTNAQRISDDKGIANAMYCHKHKMPCTPAYRRNRLVGYQCPGGHRIIRK